MLILLAAVAHCTQGMASPPTTTIHFGETLENSIDIAGDSKYFTFSADKGNRLAIQLIHSALGTKQDLLLVGPDSIEMARSSENHMGWKGEIVVRESGLHRLEVRDRSGQTGGFYLTLIGLNRTNPADEGRVLLQPGLTHTTELGPGDFDVLDIEIAAGDQMSVRASRTTSSVPWFAIYTPDGVPLRSEPDGSDSVSAWAFEREPMGALRLNRPGTFRLVCGIGSVSLERARITLVKHPWPNKADPDGGELEPFTTRTGILDPGDMDAFFFAATAGDEVTLRMTRETGSLNPEIWILDPSGLAIANPSGSIQAQVENLPIQRTGLHAVLVYDGNNALYRPSVDSGTYSLHFSGRVRSPDTTRLHFRHLGDDLILFWLDRQSGALIESADQGIHEAWRPFAVPIEVDGGFRWARFPKHPSGQIFRVKQP